MRSMILDSEWLAGHSECELMVPSCQIQILNPDVELGYWMLAGMWVAMHLLSWGQRHLRTNFSCKATRGLYNIIIVLVR